MSFLLPLLPSLISAGAGLYGSYRENKLQKRNEKRGSNVERISKFTPQQQQVSDLINSLLTGQGQQPQGGLLGELYGDEGFEDYANPAIRAFHESIAPGIAERFAGMGAGAQSSSGFQNALAQQGSQLAQALGEFRGRQRQESLSGLLSQYLQPSEHLTSQPRGGSPLNQGLGLAGQGGLSNLTKMLTDLLQNKFGSQSTPTIGFGNR